MMNNGVISSFDFHFSNYLLKFVSNKQQTFNDEFIGLGLFSSLVSNVSFSKQCPCLNLDEFDFETHFSVVEEEVPEESSLTYSPADPDSPEFEENNLQSRKPFRIQNSDDEETNNEELLKAKEKILSFFKSQKNICDFAARIAKSFPELICEIKDLKQKASFVPLVWHAPRLYLHRFWEYENEVVAKFARYAKNEDQITLPLSEICKISRYFQTTNGEEQIRATELALKKKMSIITGGPGTGKTTIASAILALHISQKPDIKISLCAPTGKAQARMAEAIRDEVNGRDSAKPPSIICDDLVKQKILSIKPSTIHRLLAYSPSQRKYDSDNQLDTDLIIIDEASMIPLSQMAALLRAVPEHAKIIFLGDADQLASVETGAVFADLCDKESCLEKNIARLKISYRFPHDGNICKLKNAVNNGDITLCLDTLKTWNGKNIQGDLFQPICKKDEDDAIDWQTLSELGLHSASQKDNESEILKRIEITLEQIIKEKWTEYLSAQTLEEAFFKFQKFRILCSHKSTLFGSASINKIVRKILRKTEEYSNGLPIMITKNDYNIKLFNGDIGICWKKRNFDGTINPTRVFFPSPEEPNKFIDFAPAMLPEHECAYAMTVHKAQGSGFDDILFIIPPLPQSPLLTREMLYTGITRTKKGVTIWAEEECLKNAIKNKTQRHSGIKEKMAFYMA
ncbi:MAG: exodeoxyribonuclease V subunit alpha [Candidatus Nanoarchaeia archaeon]